MAGAVGIEGQARRHGGVFRYAPQPTRLMRYLLFGQQADAFTIRLDVRYAVEFINVNIGGPDMVKARRNGIAETVQIILG